MRRIDLLALADLPEGTMQLAWVGGSQPVLVVHTGGALSGLTRVERNRPSTTLPASRDHATIPPERATYHQS